MNAYYIGYTSLGVDVRKDSITIPMFPSRERTESSPHGCNILLHRRAECSPPVWTLHAQRAANYDSQHGILSPQAQRCRAADVH